ncbi:BPSS1780 family membrane protein [Stenotrophomonas sp. PD6]|uniref:BPSS1780 family membrane protein n=1 Tax=Stenotrophomonas sp. PD6 TaxID=3368612 RepID=UPI003BA20717
MSEIRKLPASAGAQWLLDAFSLYRRAPLQLAVLGVIGMLVSSLILVLAQALPSWLGVLGQLVSVAVGPLVFGGMLCAVSEVDQGHRALPVHLLQPIRDRRVSHLLVPLAIQLIAIIVLGTLLYLMLGADGLSASADMFRKMQELQQSGATPSNEQTLALMAGVPVVRILVWMLLAFVTFVALSMAMFTQPALVVFDHQSGMHALRMSLQGCIRNFGAMAVFMLLGLIAAMCIYFLVAIMMQLALLVGGMGAAAFVVQLAMATVIMPLYVGAVYAAWKQMFAHRSRATPPQVPPSNGPGNIFAA